MNLIAYDPYANPALAASADVEVLPTMDELFEQADFLTIHTPMIASTKGLISASELSKMKPTARVLNVARGGIVDESALLAALEAGTIAGAGIDVFTSEPPKPGDTASVCRIWCGRHRASLDGHAIAVLVHMLTSTTAEADRAPKSRCDAALGCIDYGGS